MKKVTILFDLDGTLIDSTEAILESFHAALQKCAAFDVEDEKILSLIGHPLDFMFAHIGVRNEIEECVQSYKRHYHKIFKQKTKLLPMADEAIQKAANFAKLGIVTTKTGTYSKELMEYLGLADFFEVVIGREDVIHPKPHPEPILKAMHYMNSIKEQSWMIGDTCLDMEAAHAAKIHAIGLTCGYGQPSHLQKCTKLIKSSAYDAVILIQSKQNFS